jgi:hypothetical protein
VVTIRPQVLAGSEDAGSYAIGAVLGNPAWSTVAFAEWQHVVDPWLQVNLGARQTDANHPRGFAARRPRATDQRQLCSNP